MLSDLDSIPPEPEYLEISETSVVKNLWTKRAYKTPEFHKVAITIDYAGQLFSTVCTSSLAKKCLDDQFK
ncbi:hypothetical protein CLU79DRAFT_831551 [Phycomyces nitens]|nr:hypothetical protein CLU79DRAFT_831551 [Phycomyces nitens]